MVEFGTVGKALNDRGEGITVRQCQDQNCLGKLSIRSSSCCCAGGRHRMWSRRGRDQPTACMTQALAQRLELFSALPRKLGFLLHEVEPERTAVVRGQEAVRRRGIGSTAEADQTASQARNGARIATKFGVCAPKVTACGSLPEWLDCVRQRKYLTCCPTENSANRHLLKTKYWTSKSAHANSCIRRSK